MSTRVQVVFDCADPDRLAHFWAEALGYKLQDPPEGFATWPDFLRTINWPEELMDAASAVVDPEGTGPRIYFQKVPEPKTAKNRVHLDLNVGGGPAARPEESRARVRAEADRLVKLGATEQRGRDERGEFWIVMQDPEGNEFCVQ